MPNIELLYSKKFRGDAIMTLSREMPSAAKTPEPRQSLVRFVQLVDGGRLPRRADRTVGGTLPVRAIRYCEPVAAASGFGWYVFLPRRFQLLWDGHEIFWRAEGVDEFQPLRSCHYPGFAARFDSVAPPDLKGAAPAFLTASIQQGLVQIWPGVMATTADGWSLLVRPVANLARPSGFELLEGIIETDSMWFGPLFTNVRLTRTGLPIEFDDDVPFMQVQPLRRGHYEADRLDRFDVAERLEDMTEDDWQRYADKVARRCMRDDRQPGAYKMMVRKSSEPRDDS
jgi:hypothetical protein